MRYVLLLSVTTLLASCVLQSKYNESESGRKSCEDRLSALKAADEDCETKLTELNAAYSLNKSETAELQQDSIKLSGKLREISDKYNKLMLQNESLMADYDILTKGNTEDAKKLSQKLELTQSELYKEQDQLDKERNHLDTLTEQLNGHEERVKELEEILRQKDAAADTLKRRINDALLGFVDKGISVYEKNGKVYVSLEEQLLFPSGSTEVQPGGIAALEKISSALDANPDINIMVEGHTDDVPMHGSGDIKDNWDLSVMRATAVTKIILKDSKINPKRIMASGVSEYDPVAQGTNAEVRKKNRRTDIILTPKLNELLRILNNK